MQYQVLYTKGRDVCACEYVTARSHMEAWDKGTARAQGHERVLDVVPMNTNLMQYKEFNK
jgi:hypothetical protein